MGWFSTAKVITAENALPGRAEAIHIATHHFVNGKSIIGPFPPQLEIIQFGMGCFWGAERKFWPLEGVYTTAVGYAGGYTANPTYREVCSGETGHTEVVLVVYDPTLISTAGLLKVFWEAHDPTQGNRQGQDMGSQYRSAIYCGTPAQRAIAESTKASFQTALSAKRYEAITTEIRGGAGSSDITPAFYYAEEYHQQYLAKNPDGYCGLGGTGAVCPI